MTDVLTKPGFTELALAKAEAFRASPEAARLLERTEAFTISDISGFGPRIIRDSIGDSEIGRPVVTYTTDEDIYPAPPDDPYRPVELDKLTGKLMTGKLVEASVINGAVYAIGCEAIEDAAFGGQRPVLEMDVIRLSKLKPVAPDVPSFLMIPPSPQTWLFRLFEAPKLSPYEFKTKVTGALENIDAALPLVEARKLTLVMAVHPASVVNSLRLALEDRKVSNQYSRRQELNNLQTELQSASEDPLKFYEKIKAAH